MAAAVHLRFLVHRARQYALILARPYALPFQDPNSGQTCWLHSSPTSLHFITIRPKDELLLPTQVCLNDLSLITHKGSSYPGYEPPRPPSQAPSRFLVPAPLRSTLSMPWLRAGWMTNPRAGKGARGPRPQRKRRRRTPHPACCVRDATR